MTQEPLKLALTLPETDYALGLTDDSTVPLKKAARLRLISTDRYPLVIEIGRKQLVLISDITAFLARVRERAPQVAALHRERAAKMVAGQKRKSITAPTTAGHAEIARQPGSGAAP
jgi:hypothetical protein